MAAPTNYIKHIETYVDSSSSATQQAASVDAIAKLLKNDALTLESLVKEMGMYLTTTDNILRARGILLLAELLTRLSSEPLNDITIHSLTRFFTERLADWKALRGALVGCLALIRRKHGLGTISDNDASAVARSFMENLQVQSLGQHDRKLCFELLGSLMEWYPVAVMALGDDFVYAICEAIDGEKDPQCLLLTFHVVEMLARQCPESSGLLESFAGDLFDILGSYFPIHFTHPKGDDDVKREELSRALMIAFASTPLFEPFAIPLLLEKLSSTLPSAKVESLKYLSYCMVKYGADRMQKHLESLWPYLKDAIFTSEPSVLPLDPDSQNGMGLRDNHIATEALLLLQNTIKQDCGTCLSLILNDEDVNTIVKSIASFDSYDDITMPFKLRFHAVSRILYFSAKASIASCNAVFEAFLPHLMNGLGIVAQTPLENDNPEKDHISKRPNFGYLYLCVELLAACRSLFMESDGTTSINGSSNETWCSMLHSYCSLFIKTFISALVTSMNESTHNPYIHSGVKGLQILATFPGSFSPVSKSTFENILVQLMSIVTLQFNKRFLWRMGLNALVEIGTFIGSSHEHEKMSSFDVIVIERIISLMSSGDILMPSSLKVETISDIGMTSPHFMLKIVRELNKAISTNLSESCVHGDEKSAELAVLLLECYSIKLLPWFQNIGGFEEVPSDFSLTIWEVMEVGMPFTSSLEEKKLLEATMKAMKHAIGICSEEGQRTVLNKAFSVLSSSATFFLGESNSGPSLPKQYDIKVSESIGQFCRRDEWIISLFASIIIALRPQTPIEKVETVLQFFMRTFLNGHIPSAQALGSLLNKLPLRDNMLGVGGPCSLEEAMDVIFKDNQRRSSDNGHLMGYFDNGDGDGDGIDLNSLRLGGVDGGSIHVHAIVGLAWMGKGLLMRGHEKVKDIVMVFLSCIMSNGNSSSLNGILDLNRDNEKVEVVHLMRSAADSFHVIMSDSETCLNKRFHATIRPLYKQRFFSIMMPILQSSLMKSDSPLTRSMLHRALAHVVSDTPLSAILGEANKLIPLLLDGVSVLSEDILNRDIIYSVLLVLSAILTHQSGQGAVLENAHIIIRTLCELISYPHMMVVRETTIQCLAAMSELHHARIYPLRTQVLQALSKAIDDPKRIVRQEAVRCRRAWTSIS